MDDRANTFMVKNLNGHTFYFQAESFDSAIAWRVTIESMIMAAQSDEHSPAVSPFSKLRLKNHVPHPYVYLACVGRYGLPVNPRAFGIIFNRMDE